MSDTERVRIVDLPEATKLDDSMSFASDSRDGSGTRKVPYSMLKETIQQAGAENLAPAYDATKTYAVGDYCTHEGVLYVCSTAITTPEAWTAGHWTEAALAGDLAEAKETLSQLVDDMGDTTAALEQLTTRVDNIEEAEGLHRYGVAGVGQAAAALTRLWDSVGMTAQVGTDGDNSNVINNFDDVTPFNRRKCVGKWATENGRSVFRVHAYLGDEGYTEDGTAGDYVAVECPRAYYYAKDGVLGVSAHHYPGWRPFDIFCRDHDPEDTFEYFYAPAYALAIKDGHAVSLPGLSNAQGDYASLMAAARTYGGDASVNMVTQPMAYNFYEWALATVEFATQNIQTVMQGCCGLRHNNDDRATLREDGSWLLNNYYASRVVGESVSIQPESADVSHGAYTASHIIESITRCDADGNADANGTYTLIETEDLGLGREYIVGNSYRIGARPWQTGSCNGVSTPSGSPVSNRDSYHPCKYRWRENPYANQLKTICDLFNMRVGNDSGDYGLEWYFAQDPTQVSGNPSATDLASEKFTLLDVATDHEHYADGYIKSKLYSSDIPDIWIPHEVTGGSSSTYFCDYASLVNSSLVRSVRLGGSWSAGATAGFSFAPAHIAPAYSYAAYGADLFASKQG